ncbi:hypothetical protein SLS62_000498 [Diatrype stigma]|uniref:Uncharacterized protein n=1 Tax=Diatrype stigma TaxID=117547 RepID=A0AAN9UZY0_9PEZI
MYPSLRTLVLAIGVLGASLPLPILADAGNYDNATPTATAVHGDTDTPGRSADTPCVVTSIPNSASCNASECPASTECKLSDANNCVWARRKRPFACVQCKCVKA